MKKVILFSLILSMALAAAGSASPLMLEKGHKSLGFQASERPAIVFGWNIADMTRLHFGGSYATIEPSHTTGTTVESQDSWAFDIGVSRFLGNTATERFVPFVGANVIIRDDGENIDPSFGFRGFFGVEAFVVDSLSFGGSIGVQYLQEGDRPGIGNVGDPDYVAAVNGGTRLATGTSAVMATIYW